MLKRFLIFLFLLVGFPLLSEPGKFSGMAIGIYGTGEKMLGDYSDVATFGTGGGLCLEYTALQLSKIDFGFAGRGEFSHVFPRSESSLKSDNDLVFSAGIWFRFPAGRFAFVPEFDYGGLVHFAKGGEGSQTDGIYIDQLFRASMGIRFCPTFAQKMEFEIAPSFSLSPEKENRFLMQTGIRFGVILHIKNSKSGDKYEKI